jgi:PilZ domain-containing protein
MKTPPSERRRAARQAAQGEIRLRQSGAIAPAFVGHLVDVSPTGFRIRHSRLTLVSGDRVEYDLGGQSGAARAVWTRILGSEAETGFMILPQEG